MEQEKISVIVPVYGVEKYLRKAVDSLLSQTHRNLEIILVDDGSPDGSGAICDEYAAADARVTVIHKENGGVSSARNAGLDAATGDYIGFVDADDWTEPDMYEYLLKGLREKEADISCCRHWSVSSWGSPLSPGGDAVVRPQSLDRREINELLLPPCWNKLSKRELWDDLRFPDIKMGEDMLCTHLLVRKADRVAVLPEAKYHYLIRDGSAMTSRELYQWLDYYDASKAWYDQHIAAMPEWREELAVSCVDCAVMSWILFLSAPRSIRRAEAGRVREMSRFCAPWIPDEVGRRGMGSMGRAALKLLQYPHLWAQWVAVAINRLFAITHGGPLTLERL